MALQGLLGEVKALSKLQQARVAAIMGALVADAAGKYLYLVLAP